MNFAIAYLDINGNGFSPTCPWIEDCVNSIEHGLRMMDDMISDGYERVTLFTYGEEEVLPEFVSWDYVLKHKV